MKIFGCPAAPAAQGGVKETNHAPADQRYPFLHAAPLKSMWRRSAPLWESRWLTNMGEKHCQLEQQLAEKLGTGRVSLFTNGHMALELLLKAMGLEGKC